VSAPTPTLYLLAGPNGAGKTTFYETVLGPATALPFVNADLIAAERWPDDALAHGHDASRIASTVHDRMLADRRSFITETVFSHPSKVDLVEQATAHGYLVHLHVLLVPVELSVARVVQRVSEGGHDVPVDKIRQRHQRLWAHVAAAIGHSYETCLWDATGPRFIQVARFLYGQPVEVGDLPAWTPKALLEATRPSGDEL
jgi:predicted ABC-type ATPase